MRAAVFHGAGQPLTVEELPKPKVAPGEIVVRVRACGVCHTDLHYLDHGVPTSKPPPLVLGHEASGTVDEIGEGVRGWEPGQRVLIPAVLTCGTCEMCRRGRENICLEMRMPGNHIDGAFAEFIRVPAKDLVRLPEALPLVESCIIADAVSTPYHAVTHRARVRPGERVAVFGCGGVGINAIQFAAAAGGWVLAVDLDPSKLEVARTLGASEIVRGGTEDVVKRIRTLTGGGPDVAIECIGNPATLRQAIECIRRGGRTVVVGFCAKPVEIHVGRLMFFEQEFLGSLGCRPVDYSRILEMAAVGRIQIRPVVTGQYSLDRINEAVDALRKGEGLRHIVVF